MDNRGNPPEKHTLTENQKRELTKKNASKIEVEKELKKVLSDRVNVLKGLSNK